MDKHLIQHTILLAEKMDALGEHRASDGALICLACSRMRKLSTIIETILSNIGNVDNIAPMVQRLLGNFSPGEIIGMADKLHDEAKKIGVRSVAVTPGDTSNLKDNPYIWGMERSEGEQAHGVGGFDPAKNRPSAMDVPYLSGVNMLSVFFNQLFNSAKQMAEARYNANNPGAQTTKPGTQWSKKDLEELKRLLNTP